MRSSSIATAFSAWKSSGWATVVSEMRPRPAMAMLSKPTTDRSRGTEIPASSQASISPIAPWSFQTKTAVGASGPLSASRSGIGRRPTRIVPEPGSHHSGAIGSTPASRSSAA